MKNQTRELYKCPKCQLTVEIAVPCGCTEPCMRCCGEKLVPMLPKSVDEAHEKHLPVVSKTEKGLHVKVGSVDHPMLEAHHIVWIEVVAGSKVIRKYLKPGDTPEADFPLCENCCCGCEKILVREYCNIHGLWQTEVK